MPRAKRLTPPKYLTIAERIDIRQWHAKQDPKPSLMAVVEYVQRKHGKATNKSVVSRTLNHYSKLDDLPEHSPLYHRQRTKRSARSAVTPDSGGRVPRGAGNVLSAPTPIVGTARKRGRPPINRTPVEESGSYVSYLNPAAHGDDSVDMTTSEPLANKEETATQSTSGPTSTAANPTPTPTRPSVSLPRLAPTEAQSNGTQDLCNQSRQGIRQRLPRRPVENFFFKHSDDRTNIDALLSHLTDKCLQCQWLDTDGRPTYPGTLEEARAIVNSILSTMHQSNTSPHTFMANLATFAGAAGPLAIPGQRGRCFRLGEDEKTRHYRIEWDYRFGYLSGLFNVTQSVQKSVIEGRDPDEGDGGVDEWKRKCEILTGELKKRDDVLAKLERIVESLQRQNRAA